MKSALALATSLLSIGALSAPSAPSTALVERQQSLCAQYAYWSGNGYEILNNLWGQSAASSGSQCTYVDGGSSSGVKFHTTWTWNGGENNVKSYVYAGKQIAKGRKINTISNMQTSASWSYSTQNIRADVAYDIFTAADPNHSTSSGDYELMIW
jgi:xyloglucan-specific endo-beta-1,4-glucanase